MLAITSESLHNIVAVISNICFDTYETLFFKTVLSLAFHALLRMSEFAISSGQYRHILSLEDISCSAKV